MASVQPQYDLFGRPVDPAAQDPFLRLLEGGEQSNAPTTGRTYNNAYLGRSPQEVDPVQYPPGTGGTYGNTENDWLDRFYPQGSAGPPAAAAQNPVKQVPQIALNAALPKAPQLLSSAFTPSASAAPAAAAPSAASAAPSAGGFDLAASAPFSTTSGAAPAAPEVLSGSDLAASGSGALDTSGAASAPAAAGGLPAGPTAGVVLATLILADAFQAAVKGKVSNRQFGSAIAANPMIAQFIKPVEWASKGFGLSHPKNPRQMQRDRVRAGFSAILGNPERTYKGANGQQLQVQHHELDYNNPLHAQAVAYADPLAELFAEDTSQREDISALLANSAIQGAGAPDDVRRNLLAFVEQTGLKADDLFTRIADKVKSKSIDMNRLHVYANNLEKLTGQNSDTIMNRILGLAGVAQNPNPRPSPNPGANPTPTVAPQGNPGIGGDRPRQNLPLNFKPGTQFSDIRGIKNPNPAPTEVRNRIAQPGGR